MKLNKRWWIYLIAFLIILSASKDTSAQECQISVVPLDFGSFNINSPAPIDAVGQINIFCSVPANPVIKLSAGLYSGGDFMNRQMKSIDNFLQYNIFTNPSRTSIWGDGTGTTLTQTGSGNFNVYARIPSGQEVLPGQYNDQITITIEW